MDGQRIGGATTPHIFIDRVMSQHISHFVDTNSYASDQTTGNYHKWAGSKRINR